MNKDAEVQTEVGMIEYLTARVSRARMLQAVGAGVALAAIPTVAAADGNSGTGRAPFFQAPYFPQTSGSYTTESPQEIVGNLLTLMVFDATAAAFLLNTPPVQKALGVTGLALTVTQAIAAEDQYQVDFLQSIVPGAAPVTTMFTVDPKLLSSPADFAAFGEASGRWFTAAQLTAVREFAELGQPTLAKNMAQMAAGYADITGAFRGVLAAVGAPGYSPPNNKAFETDLFLYTRDAVALMKQLGLIGGSGIPIAYPGRDAVLAAAGPMASAVIQKAPNNASSSITYTGFSSLTGERS